MEEVLDLLMSFVDFQAFKDLMLAHKMDAASKSMQVTYALLLIAAWLDLVYRRSTAWLQCPAFTAGVAATIAANLHVFVAAFIVLCVRLS